MVRKELKYNLKEKKIVLLKLHVTWNIHKKIQTYCMILTVKEIQNQSQILLIKILVFITINWFENKSV